MMKLEIATGEGVRKKEKRQAVSRVSEDRRMEGSE